MRIKDKVNETPIQGGLDPKILLKGENEIKKNIDHYLDVLKIIPMFLILDMVCYQTQNQKL